MDSLHGCLPLHFASSSRSRWARFLRRCCRPSQLDIQYSAAQCKLLLSNPSRLYSLAALRQQQSCAREDPAFLILLLLLLTLTGIGHAAALQAAGSATFAVVAFAPVLLFIVFLVVVLSAALICKSRETSGSDSIQGRSPVVEMSTATNRSIPFDLAYAFDLHCNGSFVYAVYTQVAPLVLQPVLLLLPVVLRRWLAAALHCYGLWGYAYVSSLGYLAVGQLKSAAPLLLSASGLMVAVCCCTVAGIDFLFAPSRFMLLAVTNASPAEHAIAVAPPPVDLQVQ
ncbi:hypothetical protein ACSSS7_002297 [Eimeria intestinalis]